MTDYKFDGKELHNRSGSTITYNIFRTLVIGRFDMSVKTKEKALNLVDGIVMNKQITI
ncbi:MAG: hypothetical protein ACYC54_16020 [Sedimentisphaerales bacterium]